MSFFRLQRLWCKQKMESLMRGSRQKCEKLPFLVIWGQKGQIWIVFGEIDKNGENYQKKRMEHFSKCKLSVKFQKKQ